MEDLIIWFELAAFACSLLALPFTGTQKFLRIYPALLLLIVMVEGYYTLVAASNHGSALVYNIQVPLQYICYLFILYLATGKKGFRIFVLVLIGCIIVFTLSTNPYFNSKGYSNVWSYSFCSIVTIPAIVYTFYEMLKNPIGYNFLRNPFFYMLFAFLLYNMVTLPYFIMANWQFQTKAYENIHLILANVMSIMNYVLYTVYSISFLWIIRRKVTY